jgi:hypothetical protein
MVFSDLPRMRSSSLLRSRRGRAAPPSPFLEGSNDMQSMYPFELWLKDSSQVFFAESAGSREEWRAKLSNEVLHVRSTV